MKVLEKGSKGQKAVNLTRSHFVSSGGQGEVYAKGGKAYKIYTDKSLVIPASKIDELSVLTDPCIIKPENMLLDEKTKKPVGYTMRYIKDTHALCQAFTKAFKLRNKITNKNVLDLVQKMQKGIRHIHDNKILIVDLNEMNFLLDKKCQEVYFIDVDSYGTPHFKATAIMESIRDRHCGNKFDANTDWFSFAILSFWFWIGIHPYKGRHAKLKKMDDRMLQNVSVFNSAVSMPQVCYPLSSIPQAYRDWHKAVLENGKRMPPPGDAGVITIVSVKIDKITGTDNFEIVELFEFENDIVDFQSLFGNKVTITTQHVYVGSMKVTDAEPNARIALTPEENHPILVSRRGNKLRLYDLKTKSEVLSDICCDSFMCYEGRVYIKIEDSINEIEFIELPNKMHATSRLVANVLESATRVFDGVVVQDLLGACYVSVFPETKLHYQIRIKEADKYRILDAKFDRNILMIVGVKNGIYDRFVIRFSKDYASYDMRVVKDISYTGLNFVVLENDICACITEDEELELFSNHKDSKGVRQVDDSAIKGDMKLMKDGVKVLFATGNSLHHLSMK